MSFRRVLTKFYNENKDEVARIAKRAWNNRHTTNEELKKHLARWGKLLLQRRISSNKYIKNLNLKPWATRQLGNVNLRELKPLAVRQLKSLKLNELKPLAIKHLGKLNLRELKLSSVREFATNKTKSKTQPLKKTKRKPEDLLPKYALKTIEARCNALKRKDKGECEEEETGERCPRETAQNHPSEKMTIVLPPTCTKAPSRCPKPKPSSKNEEPRGECQQDNSCKGEEQKQDSCKKRKICCICKKEEPCKKPEVSRDIRSTGDCSPPTCPKKERCPKPKEQECDRPCRPNEEKCPKDEKDKCEPRQSCDIPQKPCDSKNKCQTSTPTADPPFVPREDFDVVEELRIKSAYNEDDRFKQKLDEYFCEAKYKNHRYYETHNATYYDAVAHIKHLRANK